MPASIIILLARLLQVYTLGGFLMFKRRADGLDVMRSALTHCAHWFRSEWAWVIRPNGCAACARLCSSIRTRTYCVWGTMKSGDNDIVILMIIIILLSCMPTSTLPRLVVVQGHGSRGAWEHNRGF